jgi:hypothetical protein
VCRFVSVLFVVVFVAGCGFPGGGSSSGEVKMTPDQAYAKLRADLEAAITQIAPDLRESVFDTPLRDVGCGGFMANEHNRVSSRLQGGLGVQDWDRDIPAAISRLQTFAAAKGYDFEVSEDAGEQALFLSTPGETADEFYMQFFMEPRGVIRFSGETPCVDNPDF